jgi:hypothetical protein
MNLRSRIESKMRKLLGIVCALALGTAACEGSGESAAADTSMPDAIPSGGASGTGGMAETGGVIATGSGGVAASGGTSVDAPTNDVSATGGAIAPDAEGAGDAAVSDDGAGGESYVACIYIGGEDFVAVMKETNDVCVLLAMATPVDSPKNLGLTLPGRWGLRTAAYWPRSMHACTGSSAPSGSVGATSGSGTASFVVQGSNIIMDLDLVLQFPQGDAASVSVPMKVKGLETSSKCS